MLIAGTKSKDIMKASLFAIILQIIDGNLHGDKTSDLKPASHLYASFIAIIQMLKITGASVIGLLYGT